ncbi:hypothetical protein WJX82_005308 [Trebouxia sp. C0006]
MCDSRSASRFSRDDIVNTRGAQCKARDRKEEQRRVPARQAPFRILAAQGKSGIWDKSRRGTFRAVAQHVKWPHNELHRAVQYVAAAAWEAKSACKAAFSWLAFVQKTARHKPYEVFINQETDPYVIEVNGTLDLAALQLQPATVVINGKKGLVDVQTSKTKRTFADIQDKVLHDATAGSMANPLHISGASLADHPLQKLSSNIEVQTRAVLKLGKAMNSMASSFRAGKSTQFVYTPSNASSMRDLNFKLELIKAYQRSSYDEDEDKPCKTCNCINDTRNGLLLAKALKEILSVQGLGVSQLWTKRLDSGLLPGLTVELAGLVLPTAPDAIICRARILSMARFASVAELETFLGRLDPDYSQFASTLWQNSVRTVHQLANAREPIWLSCGLPELYIDDIKARADRTGASSEHKRRRAKQVPIKLLHPVFDSFVKLSETLEAEPSILLLVEELCASARYYYAGEKHYQPVLEKLLQRFEHSRGRDFARTFCWSQQLYHRHIFGGLIWSCVASFILELMGSHMKIGGAVWGESPMRAFDRCHESFASMAAGICISTQRSHLYANGIPPVLHDATRFTNVQPFLQGSYAGLFSYNDAASGEARLAKFALHYGISVHKAWASIGLAPHSPTATALQCDLQLVTTELLSDKWHFLNDLEPAVMQDTRPYVLAALRQAQQVLLGNGGIGVHGDLRQTNVAAQRGEKGWMVKFVDYDWAGVAGLHRFPPFMKSQIDWPDGGHDSRRRCLLHRRPSSIGGATATQAPVNIMIFSKLAEASNTSGQQMSLLALSIVKDSRSWGANRGLLDFLNLLTNLTQQTPDVKLSLGLLISDTTTYTDLGLALNAEKPSQPSTCANADQTHASKVGDYLQQLRMQRAMVLHCPQDQHLAKLTPNTKRSPQGQMLRRRGLARLRNQLLFSALEQEDAVLWIDSDIIAAPQDMLPKMIASNLDIITPSCYFYDKSWPRWRQKQWYFDYNVFQGFVSRPEKNELVEIAAGRSFPQKTKQNRHGDIKFLDELAHNKSEFVQLNSVGGTMLWVKASVHRDGVVFPVANIVGSEWDRQGFVGLETEGICWLADFLGYKCWGMPHTVIMHDAI